MSVEAMALVLHHSQASGTDKLVLLGIANHEGDGGAWPAVATLARYANTDVRTVQRSLARLERLGELSRTIGGGGGSRPDRRHTLYRVLVACPPDCDHTTQHRPRGDISATPWEERGDTCVTPLRPRGDTHVTNGVTPASPEPSKEPSMGGSPTILTHQGAGPVDRPDQGPGLVAAPIDLLRAALRPLDPGPPTMQRSPEINARPAPPNR